VFVRKAGEETAPVPISPFHDLADFLDDLCNGGWVVGQP